MSKFNAKVVTKTKTVNRAGGEAYKQTTKLELVSLLLTSFVKAQFYRSEKDVINTVKDLVKGIKDKMFAAKAAIFARNEFGMRSITHITAGEVANHVKGEGWTKAFYNKVVHRVDDITEILSYYMSNYGKPIPNSLKRGLGKAVNKFDAYQLSKYRGEGKDLSLVDVFNLIHPKPTNGNAELFKSLMKGELKSKDTWESKLTKAGQTAKTDEEKEKLKADSWKALILENKLGYFALLRNLRNIMEQAPEVLDKALEQLRDEKRIKKSLVLPFRFMTALNEIKKTSGNDVRKVVVAIDDALEIAIANVPKLEGKTAVILDESGSMDGQPWEIGSLFASILVKSNDADLITFAESARYQFVNPKDSISSIINSLDCNGGGTRMAASLEILNKKYDRLIILSDMQTWIETQGSYFYGGGASPVKIFNSYKAKYDVQPHVYSWDLQGQGDMQFPQDKVYCLAGFSDRVFDIMKLLESDKQAMINKIESIEI